MATYTLQGPSGKTYTVEGPEGATADQIGAHILSQSPEERTALQNQSFNPASDMSTGQRTLAGIGSGMTSVLRAVGGGSLAEKLGLPATKAEGDQLDAPLLNTTAGKVGRVIGQVATVAPAALIPGANTYGGAALLGAGLGATTTEGGIEDRAKGAALGAVGGAAGQALGQAVGAGARYVGQVARGAAAARQAARAGKDAAADSAQAAGYVLPPTEISPGPLSSAVEGLSGKIKTSQAASQRNQVVTNDLAKSELGLPADQPITIDALKAIRTDAGKAYDAVGNLGPITPGASYGQALDQIVANARQAAQGFPNAKANPLIAAIDEIRVPQGSSVDAASVIAKIKELRAGADGAYASGNKELGQALKSGAGALEDAIDSHLTQANMPLDVLQGFQNARRLIAKTYSVQNALNPATGDVSAAALAGQLKRGKVLSGGLQTAAEANQAFPKATQALQQDYNALSPLDYLASLGSVGTAVGTGHPLVALGALAPLARPAVRSAVLSGPAQRLLQGGRTYNPNALAQLLEAMSPGAAPAGRIAGQSLVPARQQ